MRPKLDHRSSFVCPDVYNSDQMHKCHACGFCVIVINNKNECVLTYNRKTITFYEIGKSTFSLQL